MCARNQARGKEQAVAVGVTDTTYPTPSSPGAHGFKSFPPPTPPWLVRLAWSYLPTDTYVRT